MDGSQVLGVGLASLAHALEKRKAALLTELRQVERDMASVEDTLAAAERMGFSSLDLPFRQEPPIPASSRRAPVADTAPVPREEPTPGSAIRAYEVRKAALGSLGERYPHDFSPNIETVTIPKNLVEIDAIRESVSGIAKRAKELPPGEGGRRYMSARGLVQGEPIAPAIRRILQATDRPLSTLEVTTAFLEMRGLKLKRKEWSALLNRISSLLSIDAKKGNVTRTAQENSRAMLWSYPVMAGRQAGQSGGSSHPNGSIG